MGWHRLVSLRDEQLPNQCDQRSRLGLAGWRHGQGSAVAGQTGRWLQSPRCVAQRLTIKRAGGLSAELIGGSVMMVEGNVC